MLVIRINHDEINRMQNPQKSKTRGSDMTQAKVINNSNVITSLNHKDIICKTTLYDVLGSYRIVVHLQFYPGFACF